MADRGKDVEVHPRLKGQGALATPLGLLESAGCGGRGHGVDSPKSSHTAPLLTLRICTISEAFSFPFYKQVSRQRFSNFSNKTNP